MKKKKIFCPICWAEMIKTEEFGFEAKKCPNGCKKSKIIFVKEIKGRREIYGVQK